MLKPILAMFVACSIWGLSGAFYKYLSHLPTLEVLAHRSLWSMIFFSLVLLCQKRFNVLFFIFKNRDHLFLLLASSLMISINWFTFIYAIQINQAVQASFGYYIFPLVAVFFGFVFKSERFTQIQYFSIILAVISVLGLGYALKMTPFISMVIGVTFGLYGLIKSYVDYGAIESVTVETIFLAPFALLFLSWIYFVGSDYGPMRSLNITDFILLFFSGLITGGPLILFSYAAKRLTYSTVGVLQYINPTFQFIVAIVVFSEPFSFWHLIALILIWCAVLLYSFELWQLEPKRKSNEKSA